MRYAIGTLAAQGPFVNLHLSCGARRPSERSRDVGPIHAEFVERSGAVTLTPQISRVVAMALGSYRRRGRRGTSLLPTLP